MRAAVISRPERLRAFSVVNTDRGPLSTAEPVSSPGMQERERYVLGFIEKGGDSGSGPLLPRDEAAVADFGKEGLVANLE